VSENALLPVLSGELACYPQSFRPAFHLFYEFAKGENVNPFGEACVLFDFNHDAIISFFGLSVKPFFDYFKQLKGKGWQRVESA
tara:strand:+ start:271 stop:522 length:252 start_codon:yes stop_codon:yes gene_type:complete